jgi:ubiquinone/menaquinone biosynthesis C-methylase UbiE
MNVDQQYQSTGRLQTRINLHATYGQNRQPWHRWCFERLGQCGGLSVLEVGCGVGLLWWENRERLPAPKRLVVSDASSAMVNEAVAKLATLFPGLVSGLESCVARAEELPFAEGSFDLVIANHMLYHTDVDRALAEMHRVLRPGGRLIAACNGRRHLYELDQLLAQCGAPVELDRTAEVFGLETGPAHLKRLFEAVHSETYPDELLITEPAAVLGYLASSYGDEAVAAVADRIEQHVLEAVREFGAFRVQKASGLLSCTKLQA